MGHRDLILLPRGRAMSELDSKVCEIFAGKVVRKDLVRSVKVGANVPVYVLEYLLGKYCATDDPAAIHPIQISSFNFEEYIEGRCQLSTVEWTDLIIKSIGLEPSGMSWRLKLLMLARLIPLVERNYNLIELGPRGTGKSFIYRETTP